MGMVRRREREREREWESIQREWRATTIAMARDCDAGMRGESKSLARDCDTDIRGERVD